MRADKSEISQARAMRAVIAILAILATLAVGARALADEVVGADESAAEITVRAAESAGELAGSVRSLESSLRTAVPAPESGGVLSAAENDALVEAGAKKQLAALAGELDQLSAVLASGADLAGEKVLLESVDRRAAALSQLGARSSRVPIPPELQAELLALRSDLKTLSGSRAAVSAPVADAPLEAAP